MRQTDIGNGVLILLVAFVLWDLARPNSFLRAAAAQVASIGVNEIVAGFFA